MGGSRLGSLGSEKRGGGGTAVMWRVKRVHSQSVTHHGCCCKTQVNVMVKPARGPRPAPQARPTPTHRCVQYSPTAPPHSKTRGKRSCVRALHCHSARGSPGAQQLLHFQCGCGGVCRYTRHGRTHYTHARTQNTRRRATCARARGCRGALLIGAAAVQVMTSTGALVR
jgi:hypothetical protein